MAFEYHSVGDLRALGEKIRKKAIEVTMDQADSYGEAQQAANNDASRSDTGQLTQVPGYTTPADGRPDDDGNLRSYVTQMYAGIPDMFTAFGLPDPDNSKPMLDALYSVAATVQVDLQLTSRDNKVAAPSATRAIEGTEQVGAVVDLINGHMKDWTGNASRAFAHYLSDNVTAAGLQRQIALSLALGLEAQLEIGRRLNTDIWEIGQKTYKALDGLDGWCGGTNGSAAVAVLTISGAIAAVIFAGATAGAGAGALAAAVGVEGIQSLATILSNTGGLKQESVDIGGATVPPIITGMQNAMTKLTKAFDQQQQDLSGALGTFAGDVQANMKRIMIPGPDAVYALSTADSTTLRSPNGMFVN